MEPRRTRLEHGAGKILDFKNRQRQVRLALRWFPLPNTRLVECGGATEVQLVNVNVEDKEEAKKAEHQKDET